MGKSAWIAALAAGILLASCAPSTTPPAQPSSGNGRPVVQPEAQRTMAAALRLEPASLALRTPRVVFANLDHTRIFNADFANVDDQTVPRAYLVEALPQLNTESWKTFPDGRMETTYRFRPNLTWHDGTPFSAEDYVFSLRVYSTPDVGLSRQVPFDAMEHVEARDPRTLVIRWKRPYPDAAHLAGRDQNFPAMPRHLLEAQFASESLETFLTHPYWSRDFLGMGPYRTVHWEPGAFIEAAAFDGHTTGRPRIDRIKFVFIGDANTALASMLSGELHFAGPTALAIPQGLTLQQEWEPRRVGTVIYQTFVWRGVYFQFLPGYTTPRALLDVRVRKALAHAVDRSAVNEAINGGLAVEANYLLPPNGQWGDAVQQGAVRYGYDPRLTEQLMQEAGFAKGPDGVWVSPTEGRMHIDVRTTGGGSGPIELAALASDWQKAGFEIGQRAVPAAQSLDVETRMSYPAMELTTNRASEATAVAATPGNIPTPENRWRGAAQTSWTHPEYTRLVGLFTSTLDRDERANQVAQMARVFGEDVAAISMYFPPIVSATVSALNGPTANPPDTNIFWRIHEWELR